MPSTLIGHEQYELLLKLFTANVMSKERFAAALWEFAQAQNWSYLERLVNLDLISRESFSH